MHVLSFDTSTSSLHLALLRGRDVLAERIVEPSSANRQEVGSALLPAIDRMLSESGVKKTDLDLVVVGTGPGSFTGIRVGVITGRSIAQFLELGLMGVSLLEVIAYESERPVTVVLGAGKSHYFAGAFVAAETNPVFPVVEPSYVCQEELMLRFSDVKRWLADEKAQSELDQGKWEDLPSIKNIAVSQAQLALDRLSLVGIKDGPIDQDSRRRLEQLYKWWEVFPLYLRSPSVTLKKSDGNSNQAADNTGP